MPNVVNVLQPYSSIVFPVGLDVQHREYTECIVSNFSISTSAIVDPYMEKSCASWQILAVLLRCFAGLWFGPIYRLCVEYAQAIVLGTSYSIALRSATDREHIAPQ